MCKVLSTQFVNNNFHNEQQQFLQRVFFRKNKTFSTCLRFSLKPFFLYNLLFEKMQKMLKKRIPNNHTISNL